MFVATPIDADGAILNTGPRDTPAPAALFSFIRDDFPVSPFSGTSFQSPESARILPDVPGPAFTLDQDIMTTLLILGAVLFLVTVVRR